MWTFVYVEGVEPTNNFGEQLIRHSVMYGKTSFGTQSSEESRFVERILTAVTTLALQKHNLLNYLLNVSTTKCPAGSGLACMAPLKVVREREVNQEDSVPREGDIHLKRQP